MRLCIGDLTAWFDLSCKYFNLNLFLLLGLLRFSFFFLSNTYIYFYILYLISQ